MIIVTSSLVMLEACVTIKEEQHLIISMLQSSFSIENEHLHCSDETMSVCVLTRYVG